MARTQKHVSSLAAGGGTGGTGDPWTLDEAITNAAAGMDINIWADGVYAWTGVKALPNVGSVSQPVRWRGRSGSSGTNGDAIQGFLPSGFLDTSNMPMLGDGVNCRVDVNKYNIVEGIKFNLNKGDPISNINLNDDAFLRWCDVTSATTGAAGYGAVGGRGSIYCCDINQTSSNGYGVAFDRRCLVSRCRITSVGGGAKIANSYGGSGITNTVFYDIGGIGINFTNTVADQLDLVNVTLLGASGSSDGIQIPGTGIGSVRGTGLIIKGFGGYGVNIQGAGGGVTLDDTRFYDNALGDWYSATSDSALESLREVTTAHDDFVDAAGHDWRLLRSSPTVDLTKRGTSIGACPPPVSGILGYGHA